MEERTYWHKQGDTPLFPDALWSRPESRARGGKLLIIGGNVYGFTAPAIAYSESQKAAIGAVRVLLPESLESVVGKGLAEAEFAPSTPSGSFAQTALYIPHSQSALKPSSL